MLKGLRVETAPIGLSTSTLPKFLLRAETASDVDAIAELILEAYQLQAHSNQSEASMVEHLRQADALTLSLLAQTGDRLVGHLVVAPVTISGGAPGWFSIGPLSVAPDFHGQGIGSSLVWQGLRTMRQRGAAGCVVLGEPAYFGRFGFRSTPALNLAGAPAGCFLARPYERVVPLGEVSFHAAFSSVDPADWTFP